jgi:hypothetical protein
MAFVAQALSVHTVSLPCINSVCPTKCKVPTVGRHDPLKYMIIFVKLGA